MFKKLTTRDLTMISLFTAIICISSYIKIDLPYVPITLQTLAIMLAGSILNPRQTALCVFTYLLLGAVGAPVFAGGTAGLSLPLGGYFLGFLIGAVVISILRGKNNSLLSLGIANIVGGVIIIDLVGSIWLGAVTGMGIGKGLMVGAVPFIAGDLIKAAIATVLAKRINSYLAYNRNS